MKVERDYVDSPRWDSIANVNGMDYHRHRVHSHHHFICDEVSWYRHCVVLDAGCCYLADCSLCFLCLDVGGFIRYQWLLCEPFVVCFIGLIRVQG